MEYLFKVDESTICRIIQEISILLSKKIIIDKSRKKIKNLKELIEVCPELEEVVIDATEQKVNKKGKEFYSGRKKQNTLKTQIITDKKGLILNVNGYSPGRTHDYQYFKNSFIPNWLIKNNNRP